MTKPNIKSTITDTQNNPRDYSKHTTLPSRELNTANVKGANVCGPDDKEIGNVSHFHGLGRNAQAVVDVGTFLGTGSKRVALDVSSLNFMRAGNGKVHVTTTKSKDELKSLRRAWSGLMHRKAETIYAAAMRRSVAA